jgi:sterol 14-demethylase
MVIGLFALFFVVLTVVLIELMHQYQARRGLRVGDPPLITGWIPFLGCAISYGLNPIKFIKNAQAKFGDVFSMYTGGRIITVILDETFHPEFYRAGSDQLLFFEPLEAVRLPEVVGGIFQTETAEILMGILTSKMVPQYSHLSPVLSLELDYQFDRLLGHDTIKTTKIDLCDFMDHIIVALSTRSLCAPLCRNEGFIKLMKTLEANAQLLIRRPGILGNSLVNDCTRIRKELYVFLEHELQFRRDHPHLRAQRTDDLMDHVMDVTPDNDAMICDSVIGVSFGAIINTNAAATYLIIHLLENSQLLRAAEKEVAEVLKKYDGQLTREALKEMVLLDACALETTRLYPIVLSMRNTVVPLSMGNYIIPANRTIAISSLLAMRNPEVFKEPEKFNPYRFLPETPDYSKQLRAYIGFGQGRHLCKGIGLARLEIKMIVALLIDRYALQGIEGETIPEPDWVSLGIAFPKKRPVILKYTERIHPLHSSVIPSNSEISKIEPTLSSVMQENLKIKCPYLSGDLGQASQSTQHSISRDED